jgi:hypothetical protein
MRKLNPMSVLCILVLLLSGNIFSQTLTPLSDSTQWKHCGFSEKYMKDINMPNNQANFKIMQASAPASAVINCGRFRLTFTDVSLAVGYGFDDPTWGVAYQNCACAVANYIQSVYQIPTGDGSPIDIVFNQSWNFSYTTGLPSPGILAVGGPLNTNAAFVAGTAGFYGGNVFEHYTTGNDPDPSNIDGVIQVNFQHPFRDCSAPRNCSQYDLFSVLLHEFTHAMGWLSNVKDSPIQSIYTPFQQFSKYDEFFLYWGSVVSGPPLIKIVNNTGPAINSGLPANALIGTQLWVRGNKQNDPTANQNFPAFANPGYFGPGATPPGTSSHLGDYQDAFEDCSNNAPGFIQNYVMAPSFYYNQIKDIYTEQEARALNTMGYVYTAGYVATHPWIVANRQSFTTKTVFSNTWSTSPPYGMSELDDPTSVPADKTITNCQTATFPLTTVADPTLIDPDGDVMRIFPGSLYDIRGCSNGGINSNALSVVNAPGGDIITFTPRPTFVGRAQFGFHLWDGKEKGDFMVYTIDVNPCNPCGANLVVASDFEEAMQIKTMANPVPDNAGIQYYRDNKYTGVFDAILGDGVLYQNVSQVITENVNGCTLNEGYFGSYGFNPGNPGTPSFPAILGTKRFFWPLEANNIFRLCSPAQNCTRYILEFDIFSNINITGMTIGFTNAPVAQASFLPLVNTVTQNITLAGTWQHITIPINYCSTTPGGYLVFQFPTGWNNFDYFIDNLDLHVDPLPYVLSTAIVPSSTTICQGGPGTILNSTVTNPKCNVTYNWMPGSFVTSSINSNPPVTTQYTLTVNDGCNTATAVSTVSVTNCSACAPCTNVLTGTLTTSPLSGQSYCVNSDITIQGAVTFAACELKIATGVKIIVDNGSLLTINRSHLYACNQMWQGIVIKNAATNLSGTGRVIINSNSLVEDAIVGVDIPGHLVNTLPPGQYILSILSSVMNKNDISVRISGYAPTVVTQYPFFFQGSIFTCRQLPYSTTLPFVPLASYANVVGATAANTGLPLASPYISNASYPPTVTLAGAKPTAGIKLINVGFTQNPGLLSPTYFEIKIGNNGPPNYNVFDNLVTCIEANTSNFTCINNVFQNAQTIGKGGSGGGFGINAFTKDGNNRIQVIPGIPTGSFNNKFFDCSRSVATTNYLEHHINYCDIRSTQVNPAPAHFLNQPGKFGVYMTTMKFLKIEVNNNTLYNIENGITFNATYGLVVLPPTFTSGNGQYSGQVDMNNNIMQPHVTGFPITSQYVENAIYAANVISTNPLYLIPGTTVNQYNNQLSSVYTGIYVANWQKKDVRTISNCISLLNSPFFGSPFQFGVNHSNNITGNPFSNLIYNNTITGPGITNPQMHGAYSSMSVNEYFRCNTTQNTYSGIEFSGVPSNPGAFIGNKMQNHKYGFVLNNNAVIGPQGLTTAPMDDQWLGTWTGGNFRTCVAGGASAISSPFRLRNLGAYNPNGSGTNIPPSLITDIYAFPSTITYVTGPFYSCPSIGACPVNTNTNNPNIAISLAPSDIQTMEQIAMDQIPYPVNATESKIIGKNQLFRTLKANASFMTGSPILQNFYNTSLSDSRALFSDIEDDISAGNISTAKGTVSSFAPQNNIESNYKMFYDLYIKSLNDSVPYTGNDSTAIVNLATSCPHTDGAVVYQARALYNAYYSTTIIFNDDCSAQSSNKTIQQGQNAFSKIKDENFNAIVFPNPSAGNINIAPFGIMEGELTVSIKDVTGKLVFDNIINVTNGIAILDLDAKDGVYFVSIADKKTGQKAIKKLVIQK